MTPPEISRRFEAAQAVAVEAGRLARRYFLHQDPIEIEKKSRQDWTTTADREVEKLIVDGIRKSFPKDGFFGEKGGGSDHDLLWVIDPIDGTSNFIRGLTEWCISIAFVLKGTLELGIVHDPNADDFFAARRGKGATRNGKQRPSRHSRGHGLYRLFLPDGRRTARRVGPSPSRRRVRTAGPDRARSRWLTSPTAGSTATPNCTSTHRMFWPGSPSCVRPAAGRATSCRAIG